MTSSKRAKSSRKIKQRDTISTEYFFIITNTKNTEKNYFERLKDSLPGNQKNKVSINVILEKNLQQLVSRAQTCKNTVTPLNPNVWIVFDYDQEEHFDEIIQNAENEGIPVAWSNPCFEVWLLAYFEQIPADIGNSRMCIDEFSRVFNSKTNIEYDKSDKKIYNHLKKFGDGEDKAFERVKMMREVFPEEGPPSKMVPSTKVDLLVKMILKK